MDRPIGLMLGDATGIGPEVAVKALASGGAGAGDVVIFGDARVMELGMRDAGLKLPVAVYRSLDEVPPQAGRPRRSATGEGGSGSQAPIPLVDLANLDPAGLRRGEISAESGQACAKTLEAMIDLALAGRLGGICFAPLNKAALHRGGWDGADEHQMFARLTHHTGFFGEMNVIPEFATFRVTSHVALREAINMITPERIEAALRLADGTLRALGHDTPRIGVAALNPHCGENGLFGDEEIRIIGPTVQRVRAAGIDATGPISSDTIFLKARRGDFDGVVMMYHDQGQIATKLLGFNKGVTVTAGLKTVFTTPAHGTGFDIVGRGTADPGGLEYALRLARQLAASRPV